VLDLKEQKPVSRFERGIKLFDRELKLIRESKLSTNEKNAKLAPLFAFLGGDVPTNILQEIDLLKRYAELTKYFFHSLLYRPPEYEEFIENYTKNIESLEQEKDWCSQCELLIAKYGELKDIFKSKVDALNSNKEKSRSEAGFSFDDADEVELEAFSVSLGRIESALVRLGRHLDEAKREEQKRGFDP